MLVFTDNGRAMGLVVDEIVDIVHESVSVEIPSDLPGSLGAAIIAGKATEVLDIGYYLSEAFPNWFERKAPAEGERAAVCWWSTTIRSSANSSTRCCAPSASA